MKSIDQVKLLLVPGSWREKNLILFMELMFFFWLNLYIIIECLFSDFFS